MKDSQSPSSLKPRPLLTTIPAIAIVFLLGYILGLFSSFSFSSPPQTPPKNLSLVVKPTENKITDATTDTVLVLPQPSPPPHDLFRFRTHCSKPIPQSQVLQTILTRVYNSTSPYTNFPSKHTSSLLLPVASRLRGWGSRNRVFSDLISAVRPQVIVELGTFLGASALHMASITRNLSLPTVILCLDDFRGWPGFNTKFARDMPRSHQGDALLLHQFMLGVVKAEESDRVMPMPFSTGSSLAALCEWGVYGDLIEVDAGHDFHSAWQDINMAYAILRPGGVLFGHDYFTAADNRGVRRAVNLFARTMGLKIRPNGEHWVLSPKPED